MTTKTFDSVKLMRELRDKLSQEMEHMTPEERIRHIRDRAATTGMGPRDKTDTAQRDDSAGRPPADQGAPR